MRPIRLLKRFWRRTCPSRIPLLRSPSTELKRTAVPAGMLAVDCTNFSTFALLIAVSYTIISSHLSRSQTLANAKLDLVSDAPELLTTVFGNAIAAELLAEGCGAFAATGSEDLIFAADLLLNSFCQKEGSSSAALVLLLLIEGAVV